MLNKSLLFGLSLVFIFVVVQCEGGAMKDFIDIKTGTNFSAIMKTYPGLKELKNDDLKLKGGGFHSYEVVDKNKKNKTRANAVLEVFAKQTLKGMDLSDFISRLKINTWIKKENFDVVENMGGEMHIKFVEGNTHAVIRFANSPGQGIALSFRISDVATKDELFFYLKSEQPMDNGVQLKKFKVVEAALFIEVEVPLMSEKFMTDKHLLYQGGMISIYIDKKVYTGSDLKYFNIKFIIKNESNKKIGIDFSNHRKILYPNQWGLYNEDRRFDISEMQIVPDKLDDKKIKALKTQYQKHQLKMIEPGETLSYYTEFNTGNKKDIEDKFLLFSMDGNQRVFYDHFSEKKRTERYFIISIDGQLFYTDGDMVEQIKCDGSIEVKRDVVMAYPILWGSVTEPENVIHRP